MSVVVWDGTTLAADRIVAQGQSGDITGYATKIGQSKGKLFGVVGSMALMSELFKWVVSGEHPKAFPVSLQELKDDDRYFELLVVDRNGKVRLYRNSKRFTMVEPGNVAIGCGSSFALAALSCGKSSFGAVEVASKLNVFCGGGVDTLRFEPVEKASRRRAG